MSKRRIGKKFLKGGKQSSTRKMSGSARINPPPKGKADSGPKATRKKYSKGGSIMPKAKPC